MAGIRGYFVDHVVHKELEGRGVILKSTEADIPDEPMVMTASSQAQNYTEPPMEKNPTEEEDSDF